MKYISRKGSTRYSTTEVYFNGKLLLSNSYYPIDFQGVRYPKYIKFKDTAIKISKGDELIIKTYIDENYTYRYEYKFAEDSLPDSEGRIAI